MGIKKIEKELNIKNLDDWYKVTREEFASIEGGARLLNTYYSLFKILVNAYPDHCWLPWRIPYNKNNWENPVYVKYFMEAAAKNLGVKQLRDWYNVKAEVIHYSLSRTDSTIETN